MNQKGEPRCDDPEQEPLRGSNIKPAGAVPPMDYTNTHGVRFKLSHGSGGYTVRYYAGTGRAWPRTFRVFHCPTDECRREMFYILNNTRLCTTCKEKLIDHRSVDQEPTCQSCVLQRISQSARGVSAVLQADDQADAPRSVRRHSSGPARQAHMSAVSPRGVL